MKNSIRNHTNKNHHENTTRIIRKLAFPTNWHINFSHEFSRLKNIWSVHKVSGRWTIQISQIGNQSHWGCVRLAGSGGQSDLWRSWQAAELGRGCKTEEQCQKEEKETFRQSRGCVFAPSHSSGQNQAVRSEEKKKLVA